MPIEQSTESTNIFLGFVPKSKDTHTLTKQTLLKPNQKQEQNEEITLKLEHLMFLFHKFWK